MVLPWNETSLAVLKRGAIYFAPFYKVKVRTFAKIWLWSPLGVKGLNFGKKSVCGWMRGVKYGFISDINWEKLKIWTTWFDYEDKGDGMSLFGNSCLETEECFYSLEKESSN